MSLRSCFTVALIAASVLVLQVGAEEPAAPSDLERLVAWMSGSFSSAPQAEQDPEFFDIRLHMVPIWGERDDGHWLYVEQAVAEALDRPYRQRVYRVSQLADDLFESRVYTFDEPLRLAGEWREERPLAGLTPADLSERDGCAILMRRRGDAFVGSTLGRLCTSTLRGAAFATSEVSLTASELISWDRGFDADGVQVWGAIKGGYVFTRVEEEKEPPPLQPLDSPTEPEDPEEG